MKPDKKKKLLKVFGCSVLITAVSITLLVVFLFVYPVNKKESAEGNKVISESKNIFQKPDLNAFKQDSFDDEKQANSDVPVLAKAFPYGDLPIRGVNLGGWLVTEPFIVPSLYSNFTEKDDVKDEWSLCKKIGREKCQQVLANHYDTFVTEKDIKKIADLGLDHVRIPLGFWAFDIKEENEPYVYGSFHYLLKALNWARKYGIRVMVEFHAAPGSQNGWNHSGKLGAVKFLNKTDSENSENMKRFEKIYIEAIKFFSRKEWKNVVTLIGVLNEPVIVKTDFDYTLGFYKDIYDKTRKELNSDIPVLVYHDGFVGLDKYKNKMPKDEYKKVSLDVHNYLIFNKDVVSLPREEQLKIPCEAWKTQISKSMKDFGWTMTAEFSLATNDCGKWLNGIGMGSRYDGTYQPEPGPPACEKCTCKGIDDYKTFSEDHKKFLKSFMEKQTSAFEAGIGWFFWNFKTENGVNPHWDYFLGVDNGWISKDARNRDSKCD